MILTELAAGDFVGVEREIARARPRRAGVRDAPAGAADPRRGRGAGRSRGPLHDALAGMREVHALLEPAVAERIIFDLGLVRSLGYYTGAVFQVYDPAYGVPIGSGGRYDELLGAFGRPLPAVGFALNVERVHIALTGEERGRPVGGGR